MYTDIPSLKRCCCCAPLRYGLLAWAYIKLAFNIVFFGGILATMSVYFILMIFVVHPLHVISIFALVLMLIFSDIIFNIVLIVGAHKKHTTLLRLYFRYGIVHGILIVAVGILSICYVLTSAKGDLTNSDVLNFVAGFTSTAFMFLILHIYLLILVRSEIIKLKPIGDFEFVNHAADPTCVMHCDDLPPKSKEVLP